MNLGLGIDTGGTYTDSAIVDLETGKVMMKAKALPTRNDLSIGISDSIAKLANHPRAMAAYVADNVHPGAIVLHVWSGDRSASRAALPLILKALTDKGYRMVTVGELLNGS